MEKKLTWNGRNQLQNDTESLLQKTGISVVGALGCNEEHSIAWSSAESGCLLLLRWNKSPLAYHTHSFWKYFYFVSLNVVLSVYSASNHCIRWQSFLTLRTTLHVNILLRSVVCTVRKVRGVLADLLGTVGKIVCSL